MGLILKTSEIKSTIGQMRTGLQGMSESYNGALQVIQEFTIMEANMVSISVIMIQLVLRWLVMQK